MRLWMILGAAGAAVTGLYLVNKNSGKSAPAKPASVPANTSAPPTATPAPETQAQTSAAKSADARMRKVMRAPMLKTKPGKLAPGQAPPHPPKPVAPSTAAPPPPPEFMDSTNSLPDLAGLRAHEYAEPGFVRAIIETTRSVGGDPDRVAAVMLKRSKFDPGHVTGKLTETGKPGYGLMGWSSNEAYPVGPNGAILDPNAPASASVADGPSIRLRDMTGLQQIRSALVKLFTTRPYLARDPSLMVLVPYETWINVAGLVGRADKTVVVRQPNVDIISHARTPDEEMWPRIGHWDKNKDGIVTLGDIRHPFYNILDKVGGRVPA